MKMEELKTALENAFHEIGHAYAYVGQDRFLAALIAVDKAQDSIKLAHDALDNIQD